MRSVGLGILVFFLVAVIAFSVVGPVTARQYNSNSDNSTSGSSAASTACTDDSELKLPPGFCATIFADGIGHARHLVVAPNGVVYVNTWSGTYYAGDKSTQEGGFLVALEDK